MYHKVLKILKYFYNKKARYLVTGSYSLYYLILVSRGLCVALRKNRELWSSFSRNCLLKSLLDSIFIFTFVGRDKCSHQNTKTDKNCSKCPGSFLQKVSCLTDTESLVTRCEVCSQSTTF